MSLTKQRTIQYIGLILIFLAMAGGYWYYRTRAASQINAVGTNGLVGYWTFDTQDVSGTSAIDRSGNNNTGTLTNGPTIKSGKIGEAINLDGSNDYVSVAYSSSFNLSGSLTLSMWIKTNNASAEQVLLAKGNSTDYLLELYTGKLNYQVATYQGDGQLSTGTISSGTWYHVALVHTGGGGRYVLYQWHCCGHYQRD